MANTGGICCRCEDIVPISIVGVCGVNTSLHVVCAFDGSWRRNAASRSKDTAYSARVSQVFVGMEMGPARAFSVVGS